MRKKILVIPILMLLSPGVYSQETDSNIEKLKLLSSPSSPASTILGMQPSVISKPKTTKDLEIALFNNFYKNNSLVIPNDYGMEVMPFWLFNQKNVDETEYLNHDGFRSPLYNLSISIAATNNFKIMDSLNTNAIGLGAKTFLYRSEAFDKKQEILKSIYKYRLQSTINTLFITYAATVEPEDSQTIDFVKAKALLTSQNIRDKIFDIISEKNSHFNDVSRSDFEECYNSLLKELSDNKAKLMTEDDWRKILLNSI